MVLSPGLGACVINHMREFGMRRERERERERELLRVVEKL